MTRLRSYIILCTWIAAFYTCAEGQETYQCYNANVYNGLPSNHVYGSMIDDLGYLWLCTENGVVQYNGYTFKIYGSKDGLPNNDVWGLYQDSKRRIWLQTISNNLGYLYKGRYKNVALQNIHETLYPMSISSYRDGVMVISSYTGNRDNILCIEKNDTVRFTHPVASAKVTDTNEIVSCDGQVIKNYILQADNSLKISAQCRLPDSYLVDPLQQKRRMAIKNRVVVYLTGSNVMTIYDVNKCSSQTCSLTNADGSYNNIIYGNTQGGQINVFTEKCIYRLDSNLRVLSKQKIADLVNTGDTIDGFSLSYYMENSFWGKCICTQSQGVYIDRKAAANMVKMNGAGLKSYTYIGNANGAAFWWNEKERCLVRIDTNLDIRRYQLSKTHGLKRVVPYRGNTSILLTIDNLYLFSGDPSQLRLLQECLTFTDSANSYFPQSAFPAAREAMVQNDGSFYVVFSSKGIQSFDRVANKLLVKRIDGDRYNNVIDYAAAHAIIAYNNNKILVHIKGRTDIIVEGNELKKAGINNVEKICVSPYGALLIKDNKNLFSFNPQTFELRRLFREVNLADAHMYMQDGEVILAGKFGLLFSKVIATDSFSNAIVYPNIKNYLYYNIIDAAILKNKVIVSTDRGVYKVQLPAEVESYGSKHAEKQYKFIVEYNGDAGVPDSKKEIPINQKNNKLHFDVINPSGNGELRFRYMLRGVDTAWNELNPGDLYLPALKAGEHYELSVVAYDDVWRSGEIKLRLYIVPYWWQTGKGLALTWAVVIASALLLLIFTILITQRMSARKHTRKSQMLAIEIKSVYSQINPHFIYNSLNAAMYFIRKNKLNEAYDHISKFSRLLRAYLKSSRNRYITLADEIVNLSNYIELQQARFTNTFEYKINLNGITLPEQIQIPSLLLQPVVENAINHGLMPKEEKGQLIIDFKKGENEEIICTIEDDGIGRKQSKKLRAERTAGQESYGEQLVEELVHVFNKYERTGITITYTDKELPSTGTIVTINIKRPHHEN